MRARRPELGTEPSPGYPDPAQAAAGEGGEVLHEVESIIEYDHESDSFLVSWVGFPAEADSWEERYRLDGAPDIVNVFEAAGGRTARPTTRADEVEVHTRRPTTTRRARPLSGTAISSRAAAAMPTGAAWLDSPQQAVLKVGDDDQGGQPSFGHEAFRARALSLESASREESTRRLYGAHWCTFVCWLLSTDEFASLVLENNDVVLPIKGEVVAQYAAFLSWYIAPGTINIALAAISAIHEHAGLASPSAQGRVRRIVEGLQRRWISPRSNKMILLPQHVRAITQLVAVRAGDDCAGRAWTRVRLERAKLAVVIGFICFLRKTEILALDKCDVVHALAGAGRDVIVRHAKNDPRGKGRSAVMGNTRGDGTGVCEMLDGWEAMLQGLQRGECTKNADRRKHCKACGWFFPRIGGRPAVLIRDPDHRDHAATTDFISSDTKQMLRQLQHDGHPDVSADLNVDDFTTVCLRRAGNSIAAAEGVASALRQVQGRWVGETTHDQHYIEIHRYAFESMGQTLMLSEVGSGGAPSRRAH